METVKSIYKRLSFSKKLLVNIILLGVLVVISCNPTNIKASKETDHFLKPYSQNPKYWEFKGEPVLLLGATDDDNLFQMQGLEKHLDELHQVGGNYIRNTMSSRDSGNVWPFNQQEDGLYDLDRWGQEYWNRFELLLQLCGERDIIIQIEVWDRFDFSRSMGIDGAWDVNPFYPANNTAYSIEESGLEAEYPSYPSGDLQPFFHAVAGMDKYDPKLEVVKKYQERLLKSCFRIPWNTEMCYTA